MGLSKYNIILQPVCADSNGNIFFYENTTKVNKGGNRINLAGLTKLAGGYYNFQIITDTEVINATLIKQ